MGDRQILPRHTARTFAGCLLMRPRWYKKAPATAEALSIVSRRANQWMASFFSRSSKYFRKCLSVSLKLLTVRHA